MEVGLPDTSATQVGLFGASTDLSRKMLVHSAHSLLQSRR